MNANLVSIEMQKQCCRMWCWAAALSTVVESCSLPCSAHSQSEFANQFIVGSPDCSSCCPNGPPDRLTQLRCDIGADPLQALSNFNLSHSPGRGVDVSTFDIICQQVDSGRPVIAQIDYAGNKGSHLLLIYGYNRPNTISFGDPANGECTSALFSAFRNPDAYTSPDIPLRHGTWTMTYVFDAI